MSSAPAAPSLELASRLVDGEDLPAPATLTADATRALGWAVKDLCYAAWSSEPQRAVRAAGALRRLRDAARDAPVQAALPEIEALAAWTDGIARVIQGEMDAATTCFDVARAAFDELGQPRHAAQTQVPKIMALAMLGRHDDATLCADAAQRALLEHGDLPAAGKVTLNLGNLHLRADRYGAAAERFGEAGALFARIGDHEHSLMADIGLADALTAFGSFEEAERTYARAHARAATHGFPVLQALVEESVALLDLVRGRFREALAGLEGARRRYAELEMPQHLAIAEKQLADAYLELRLLPEALAGYETALQRFGALEMQVDRAWTALQRGRALALSGQRDAAAASLAEAARDFGALHDTAGGASVSLAQAELALACHAGDEALALAREAADCFHRAGLTERRLRAESVQAQALLHLGDFVRAHSRFDATLGAAREHQLLPVQLRCLTGRAMATRALGARQTARRDLEAAIELFEDQRRTLPGDEVRSAFQGDHMLPFQQLLGLELEAHERGEAAAADVLAQLDRFRARTLADRLGAASAENAALCAESQQAGVPELRARLAWLYRRLRRLDDEAGATLALTDELRATERGLLEHTRRIRLSAAAATAGQGLAELDIAALQKALAAGDAIVEYGTQGDELFACVVTRAGVEVVRRLAAWPQVVDAVRALRFQIETLRHGSAPVAHHMATLEARALAHLQRLHALVWQPLAAALGEPQRVLIVPHAQLASVPFAALHDGVQCIAERAQIAVAPSARIALRALSRKPPAARSVLALGESTRLPHAAHEANTVAGLLPQGQAFVGEAATLANLLAHAGSADVIHLACHAQYRSDNPVFSALHLHDGALAAEAIENLRLPGAIVVLSACETALHDAAGGDEMFGLTRAFLVAGASRVLAALWPVDDATTAELMSDFYAGLRRSMPPAAALRRAQLAARQRRTHPHPFYWASFCMTGGW